MQHLSTILRGYCFCLLIPLSSEVHATAEDTADIDVLEIVVDGIRANQESLRSWRGRAQIEDSQRTELEFAPTATILVDFAYDALEQNLRWNFDASGRNTMEGVGSYKSSQMIRDGELHRFGPYSIGPVETRPIVVITPTTKKRVEGLADEFHPMYFLEATRGGEHIADFIERLHDHLAERRTDSVSLRRNGPEIILTFVHPEESGGETYVFDARHAYNLTRYQSQDTLAGVQWTFAFAHFEDVSLPVRWTYDHFSFDGTEKQQTFSRAVRFFDHKVNLPLSPSEFTFQAMGVQAGDFVEDKIRETAYQAIPKEPDSSMASKPFGTFWRLGAAFSVLVIVSTLAYFVLLRPRSSASFVRR